MAKKKSKQAAASGDEGQNATLDEASQTQTQPSTTTTTNSSTNGGQKKKSKASKELTSTASSQTLNICRNK
jgi:hypothetical protein